MQWSKLKQKIEANFADALAGRLEVHMTCYRRTHDAEGRAWLTHDKAEVFSFCTLRANVAEWRLAEPLQDLDPRRTSSDREQRWELYVEAYDQARELRQQDGIYAKYEFGKSLSDYLNLDVGEAIQSTNAIVRALAVVDKRIGKRRLRTFPIEIEQRLLVRTLYNVRCQAEGLVPGAGG